MARDHHMERELALFIENDSGFYHARTLPIQRNLTLKWSAGTYDHEKAPMPWKYLVDAAAKAYCTQHDAPGTKIAPMTRAHVAATLADIWRDEMECQLGPMPDPK